MYLFQDSNLFLWLSKLPLSTTWSKSLLVGLIHQLVTFNPFNIALKKLPTNVPFSFMVSNTYICMIMCQKNLIKNSVDPDQTAL